MIKDTQAWDQWEKKYKREPVNLELNLRLLESMFAEARSLNLFPPPNPLQDLEVKIEMARVVNVSKAA